MDFLPPRLWSIGSTRFSRGAMFSKLVRIALSVETASEKGDRESTITWAFHSASVGSGMGYLNNGTQWGLAGVGAARVGGMRRGKKTLPSIPL